MYTPLSQPPIPFPSFLIFLPLLYPSQSRDSKPPLPFPLSTTHHFEYLPLRHLSRHGRVELGEPLAKARLRRHGLGHAPADAARLAARERLGGEVVDAGVEAGVDEVAEDLEYY